MAPKIIFTPPMEKELTKRRIVEVYNILKRKDYSENNVKGYGNLLLRELMNFQGGFALFTSENACFVERIKLYRTRSIKIEQLDKFKSIREFLSPPESMTPWGRLNREGQPMLYAALEEETAYMENTSIIENFLLIEIEVIKEFNLHKIGKLVVDKPQSDVIINKETLENEVYCMLNSFVENLMLETATNENYYKFTNGILEMLPKDNENGYYYQSAKREGYYNVAINPKLEEQNLKIKKVWLCKKKNEKDFIKINEIDIHHMKY